MCETNNAEIAIIEPLIMQTFEKFLKHQESKLPFVFRATNISKTNYYYIFEPQSGRLVENSGTLPFPAILACVKNPMEWYYIVAIVIGSHLGFMLMCILAKWIYNSYKRRVSVSNYQTNYFEDR